MLIRTGEKGERGGEGPRFARTELSLRTLTDLIVSQEVWGCDRGGWKQWSHRSQKAAHAAVASKNHLNYVNCTHRVLRVWTLNLKP